MAKVKDKAGGSKKEEQTNYDPSILHNTYVQACNSIGIKPYDFETNADGEQIIITGSSKKENDRLSSGGCRALMKALSGKLNTGDDVLSTVEPFTSLKDLRIRSSNIQDTGALAVATFLRATAEVKKPKEASEETASTAQPQPQWKLQYLDLSDNVIGHQGALQIGRSLEVGMNKTLSTLILDFNPLGSAGAFALCKGLSTNSSLKVLSLRHCAITNSTEGDEPIFCAMLSFKRLALTTLDLSSNTLEGKGLKEQLCSGLEQNSSLTTLRLADNNIREDVAALEEFGKVLSRNSTLTDIDLSNNLIGSKGGKCLLHYVSENKHITTFKVSEIGMDTETYTALFRVSNVAKGKGKKKGKKESSKKK